MGTALTPTQLKALFETNDIPTSANYADLFDSFISVADNSAQSIQSDLTINGALNVDKVTASSIQTGGIVTGVINANTISTSALRYSVNSSIAALGGTLASAFPLAHTINVIRAVTSATNDGVVLQGGNTGSSQVVFNRAASLLLVYPSTAAATIDSIAAGSPFKVTANTQYSFTQINNTTFYSGK